ncbi:hypothetical protein Nmul_A1930 [Nitrosospira multiformis ATCC 25196]|uniref:Uncharacterized protein n=1 Tax=Nitrosospira multiformis (strain ATCC 25196 / NCIMB 11849 / C 71) TaxID=323848 RepID=Q2Y7P6_NITMU|nr:hypothetical protein Nmul_A1930 [Nitrosospira multiformis ATCC 25196]
MDFSTSWTLVQGKQDAGSRLYQAGPKVIKVPRVCDQFSGKDGGIKANTYLGLAASIRVLCFSLQNSLIHRPPAFSGRACRILCKRSCGSGNRSALSCRVSGVRERGYYNALLPKPTHCWMRLQRVRNRFMQNSCTSHPEKKIA